MDVICGWSVANSILIKSFEDKVYLTPAKLNCLIYLLYSEYLFLTGHPLFNELFSKTKEGPVIDTVYFKFNSYGNDIIRDYAKDAKGKTMYVNNPLFVRCLNYVWEKYKNWSLDDVLLYIETGHVYRYKKIDDIINNNDILSDVIMKKEMEIEQARGYVKRIMRQI